MARQSRQRLAEEREQRRLTRPSSPRPWASPRQGLPDRTRELSTIEAIARYILTTGTPPRTSSAPTSHGAAMMSRVTRPPSTERSGRTSTKPSPNACRFRRTKSDVLRGALPLLLFRIVQFIVQDMQKSGPPPLLPLLRSRLQAEMLTLVLLHPDREWTMTELASRVGSAVSSVQREIVRAEQAGVMTSRRVGKTRLVKAAGSPITGPLTGLLLRSLGLVSFSPTSSATCPGSRAPTYSDPGLPATPGREGCYLPGNNDRLLHL